METHVCQRRSPARDRAHKFRRAPRARRSGPVSALCHPQAVAVCPGVTQSDFVFGALPARIVYSIPLPMNAGAVTVTVSFVLGTNVVLRVNAVTRLAFLVAFLKLSVRVAKAHVLRLAFGAAHWIVTLPP